MENILDFLAHLHTPWSHARGRAGTLRLLGELPATARARILDLGFGTGQTLVEIRTLRPQTRLFGLEKSPLMLQKARQRLLFCGLRDIELRLYETPTTLPYPDGFFDAVCAESVLGILPDEDLPGLFCEIFRVLRPGGVFLNNESLWRPRVSGDMQEEINRRCRSIFGIPQASEKYGRPDCWRALAEAAGFSTKSAISLENVPAGRPGRRSIRLWRSDLFSNFGKMKARILPAYRSRKRAIRKAEAAFASFDPYLEGTLFVFSKPG